MTNSLPSDSDLIFDESIIFSILYVWYILFVGISILLN